MFIGNTASMGGGAGFFSNSSMVSFEGETSFLNNTASLYGGDLYVTGGSNITWTGNATCTHNVATSYYGYGGAMYMTDHSKTV